MKDFGLEPAAIRILSENEISNENILKNAILSFTKYKAPVLDELPPESPFDSVIFAGGPEFALRVAPLLAYYDVGSDRALFIGNALWNQDQLLKEPSLQGGVFATRPSQFDENFATNWHRIWSQKPGELSRLGFDALALILALAKNDSGSSSLYDNQWSRKLVNNRGFQGYSGAFRLLPDGSNVRAYELRRIQNGVSKVFKAAPDKI